MNQSSPAYTQTIPWPLRLIGASFPDSRTSWRMKWGELSLRKGLSLELCMFSGDYGDEGRFSLKIHAIFFCVFINLPFLARYGHHPEDMMESWGFGTFDNALSFHWGRYRKTFTWPWSDWRQVAHEVRRPDGSWVPFVGSWEERQTDDGPGKEPDGRHLEQYPYFYLCNNGDRQEVVATISVERRTRRLRWLRWPRLLERTIYAIDVQFSNEVGDARGSWKGGAVGCGYELQPDETPYQCLRRMQKERRFR